MPSRFLSLFLALAFAGGALMLQAPEAGATGCEDCKRICERGPGFLKSMCLGGCKPLCKAAQAVAGAASSVAGAVKKAWDKVVDPVVKVGKKAVAFVKTTF